MSKTSKVKNSTTPDEKELTNSLTNLLYGLQFGSNNNMPLNQFDTMFNSNRWYMVSNYRHLLSAMYVEHGLVQTLIDLPVDDSFRAGFEIKTGQLSADEIKDLEKTIARDNYTETFKQGIKWSRLFGGGGVLIIVSDQDPTTPLSKFSKNSKIQFKSVDMWELSYSSINPNGGYIDDYTLEIHNPDFMFDYYGHPVHNSRVLLMNGKEATSFHRPRLRGWGMSELERFLRSLNSYLKNQDVIFELLDESKVDVYKIKNFNASLLTSAGTNSIRQRIQLSNQLKNYQNAIVMDVEDEYEQKTLTFSGLGDVVTTIKQSVASDLRIPMTKLFGQSAAGFSSGEDDIENYNGMLEGEIRSKYKGLFIKYISMICHIQYGFIPEDLDIEFKPLRILSAEQEEKVKDMKLQRVLSAFSAGLFEPAKAKEMINRASLLPIEIDVDDEIFENPQNLTPVKTGAGDSNVSA